MAHHQRPLERQVVPANEVWLLQRVERLRRVTAPMRVAHRLALDVVGRLEG